MFEDVRKKARGLYSPFTRDRRKLMRQSRQGEVQERGYFESRGISSWPIYDSDSRGQFVPSHVGEGFGDVARFEEVRQWIDAQHALGKKISSIDVCGQPKLGLEAGVDKAIGWSLVDARRESARGTDARQMMIEGSIFDVRSRDFVLKEIDALRSKGVGLGVVFFRPVSGVGSFKKMRYAHLYLYEKVLRPLYERLEEGGMMFLTSQQLAGMHLLIELLGQTPGLSVKTDAHNRTYRITKTGEAPTLRRLSDMGSMKETKIEFLISEFEQRAPNIPRLIKRLLRRKGKIKRQESSSD